MQIVVAYIRNACIIQLMGSASQPAAPRELGQEIKMTIRYFAADVEDAVRIAIVKSDSDDGFDGFRDSEELAASDLPDDFAAWAVYERFSHGNNIVLVKSADGA